MNIQPQPSNSLSYFPLPVIELGTKKKCCKKYKKKGRHCKKCPRVEMMRKHLSGMQLDLLPFNK